MVTPMRLVLPPIKLTQLTKECGYELAVMDNKLHRTVVTERFTYKLMIANIVRTFMDRLYVGPCGDMSVHRRRGKHLDIVSRVQVRGQIDYIVTEIEAAILANELE